ncbi:MAG: phosphatidylglycerophosphatase A [Acidobacteria bacterium]|nr:phosphatidylglycerophosphatase A [Acidobacteriota bacterium]MBS1867478.1 phosphatidylglycerophosphatase A [Acidobacteriota bacterium]
MTPSAEASAQKQKPSFALLIATALGVGYAPKAPGTFGSLVGVITIFLSAVFFLRPAHWTSLFSLHPLQDSALMDQHFLVPGSDIHDAAMWLPLVCAFLLLIFLALAGVWASQKAADYSGLKDPQFVVIDEVAGQHLTLVLPLIPIALPHLASHEDFSIYAIFTALSLVNWKYLLVGFVLFRVFDIWKPYPIKKLENLPGGWGIMADDWLAGVYAAILLRAALHFGLV